MKKIQKIKNKIINFFQVIYVKFFKINDTPQRVALGLGLGVFAGIIPGTGPIAALFLAFLFRVNRAAALLGSLLTNTWLSFVTFILAVKVGAAILKVSWQAVFQDWLNLIKEFNWLNLFKASILKTILPVVVGYIAIAFFLGFTVYLITLFIIIKIKQRNG